MRDFHRRAVRSNLPRADCSPPTRGLSLADCALRSGLNDNAHWMPDIWPTWRDREGGGVALDRGISRSRSSVVSLAGRLEASPA
jgi:hypothetical protein